MKKNFRRVEVFVSIETRHYRGLHPVVGRWKTIPFKKLKKGDVFRLWDTWDDGKERPDQVIRGRHVVNVALTDVQSQPAPALGVVECLPIRGFK